MHRVLQGIFAKRLKPRISALATYIHAPGRLTQVKEALIEKLKVFADPGAVSDIVSHKDVLMGKNIYSTASKSEYAERVRREVTSRLDLPFHSCLSPASSAATLQYLFFHMRCGIFVMFRGGKLVMFVPFVNKDYENNWGDRFAMEAPFSEYYDQKSSTIVAKILFAIKISGGQMAILYAMST